MERDIDFERRYRDEQIAELKSALTGTIVEKGSFNRLKRSWEINYSSILTKLIQEAGRWCEYYASDLFIGWKYNIENKLEDGTIESGRYVFAIRDSGVDGKEWYENHKDEHNYYRAVWFLDVEIEDDKIKMTLHK